MKPIYIVLLIIVISAVISGAIFTAAGNYMVEVESECHVGELFDSYCSSDNVNNITYYWYRVSEPNCTYEGFVTENVTDFIKVSEYKGNLSDIVYHCLDERKG